MPPISFSPYSSALSKPSFLSSSMRALPVASISSRGPKNSACAGHVFTQAGWSPWPTRSSHRVHLLETPKFGRYLGTSNGQAALQYLQPMHLVLSSLTVPLSSLLMALLGQTGRQAGSVQWKHAFRMKAHSTPLSVAFSAKVIRRRVSPLSADMLW